jgi:hypothetical protein
VAYIFFLRPQEMIPRSLIFGGSQELHHVIGAIEIWTEVLRGDLPSFTALQLT